MDSGGDGVILGGYPGKLGDSRNTVPVPWTFWGPPKLQGTLPLWPDSRRAGRIFRNLEGGIRGARAGGVALPHSTPLLAVWRPGPCSPAGAPPLFPGPSREGEGVPSGFLPPPAPRRGGAGKPLLGAQSLEASHAAW